MNFPTITIPDPAAVGKWLDDELPDEHGLPHRPIFIYDQWCLSHFYNGRNLTSFHPSPEEGLADLKRQIAAIDEDRDELTKVRKQAAKLGYALMKLPED